MDSISHQAWEKEGTVEIVDVPNEETYQTPLTIFFDDGTSVEEGDEVKSETVLSLARKKVMVWNQKRSHFYLSPYVNKPSKIGRWRMGRLPYHTLIWLDEAKYSA